MILSCVKTGRWWTVRDHQQAHWMARTLGLKDYEIAETVA